MKGICLRCGKDFVRLDKHLSNKKVCIAIYLDIQRERVIPEYSTLINEFLKIQKKYNDNIKCNECGKIISKKSNMARHKRIHMKKIEISNTNDFEKDENISSDLKIDDTKHINNFEKEADVCYDLVKNIIENKFNVDTDYLVEYFRYMYIKDEHNRNIYLSDTQSKKIYIYQNNDWKYINKIVVIKKIIEKILNNFRNHINIYVKEIDKNDMSKYENYIKIVSIIDNTNNYKDDMKTTIYEIENCILYNKDILEKNFELMTN